MQMFWNKGFTIRIYTQKEPSSSMAPNPNDEHPGLPFSPRISGLRSISRRRFSKVIEKASPILFININITCIQIKLHIWFWQVLEDIFYYHPHISNMYYLFFIKINTKLFSSSELVIPERIFDRCHDINVRAWLSILKPWATCPWKMMLQGKISAEQVIVLVLHFFCLVYLVTLRLHIFIKRYIG